MSIILRHKLISETPGEMANTIKKEMNLKKISYCGKLDPMSRGIMLFLTNEMCNLNFINDLGDEGVYMTSISALFEIFLKLKLKFLP